MIDLLDYLRGDGRLYELVNNLGTNEIIQTQTEPNNVFFHVKNRQWEELWSDEVYIYRGTDTSPGNGQLYLLSENNHYGSAWVPRWFEVGQLFTRSAVVMWRYKDSGAAVLEKPTATAVTYIRLERLYSQLTFQSGIQLTDVVELHAYVDDGGHPASAPWEKYFYAKGFGLVAFEDMYGGFKSWITQKFTPSTMPQRVREVISWLVPLQKRYYLPSLPTTVSTGQFVVSKMPSTWVNVRAYPNVYGKDVGDLRKDDTVTLFTPEVGGWVKVQVGSLQGWVSRQNGAVEFTSPDGSPPSLPPLPVVKPLGKYTLTQLPASWANVRDYPNESGQDIGDLHKDDVVTLYTPEVDGWVFVKADNLEGWVWRQEGKVDFTPVPSTPTDPIPPDDLPPLPAVKPVGQFVVVKMPGTWINIRAYPDTVGADVGDLQKGDIFTLYAPEVNGWAFVDTGEVHGWISKQDGKVEYTAAITDSPIPHDDLPELPTVKPAGKYTLSKLPGTWINIRAYPDAIGADVGDLHKGDAVTLFTPEVEGWVFVDTGTMRGWVSRQNGKVAFEAAASATSASTRVAEQAAALSKLKREETDISAQAAAPADAPEDAARLRDAYQQVEDSVKRVRSEIERIINRKRD